MMIRLITTTSAPDGTFRSVTQQDVSVAEADTILDSLGLTLISRCTLERFVGRSPGNRLTVKSGNEMVTFAAIPTDER